MELRKTLMAATLLAATACFAQNASSSSPGQSINNPSGITDQRQGNSQNAADATKNNNDMDHNNGKHAKGEKTLKGCIRQDGSTFWLEEKNGKKTQLNSSQDLSAHVGHEVKVHGMWGMASSASLNGSSDINSSASTSNGDLSASASTTPSSTDQSTASTSSSTLPQSDKNTSSSDISGQTSASANTSGQNAGVSGTASSTTGQSSTSASASTTNQPSAGSTDIQPSPNSGALPQSDKDKSMSSSSGKTFDVTSIDMVSDHCTMKGDKDKDKNSSSDMDHMH